MNRWADPEIIKQMESIPQDEPSPDRARYVRAMMEADANSKSADPAVATTGKLLLAFMPLMQSATERLERGDVVVASAELRGLANGLAMARTSLLGSMPPVIATTLREHMESLEKRLMERAEQERARILSRSDR